MDTTTTPDAAVAKTHIVGSGSSRLADYPFVDLYLWDSFSEFKGLKGSPNIIDPTPPELRKPLAELHQLLRLTVSKVKSPEFSQLYDGVVYRVTMVRDVDTSLVFVLRKSSVLVRPLEQVGFSPTWINAMVDPNINGLILIAGGTGHGKTSTAAAIIRERLLRWGGVAVTIEDPVETNLNGRIGKGRCIAIPADRRFGGYKEHIVRSMRMNPDMILLSEVREEAAAQQVAEAAVNGHMVVSTIHAGSIQSAIERLASLASYGHDMESTHRKLAMGLKMVIWQELVKQGNGQPPKFNYQCISLMDNFNAGGARNNIATGQIGALIHEIELQMNLARNNPLGRRS